MVATRLLEVKEKATEWMYGAENTSPDVPATAPASAVTSPSSPLASPLRMAPRSLNTANNTRNRSSSIGSCADGTTEYSYWTYATDSLHAALMGMVSSLYSDRHYMPSLSSSPASSTSSFEDNNVAAAADQQSPHGTGLFSFSNMTTARRNNKQRQRRSSLHRGTFQTTQDLASTVFENPFNSVRGRQQQDRRSSVRAVRSLLALVPVTTTTMADDNDDDFYADPTQLESISENVEWNTHPARQSAAAPPPHLRRISSGSSVDLGNNHTRRGRSKSDESGSLFPASAAETASQLAEGTIRALRDTALDEAVELQLALRFWSARWENPFMSWLEAGPWVWTSEHGYNHQHVGAKVAQLQAVLARRCAAIGELQQHLLRAGWQQGVAQWGVLHGGEWAAVAGFGATTRDEAEEAMVSQQQQQQQSPSSKGTSESATTPSSERRSGENRRLSTEIGDVQFDPRNRLRSSRSYKAKVFVQKNDGGGLFVDDPGFMAEWSVEAIALIRKHLFRAGNGMVILPYESNWSTKEEDDDDEDAGTLITGPESSSPGPLSNAAIPTWASETIFRRNGQKGSSTQAKLAISNLPLLAAEVEMLLDVMEDIMAIQRHRRLDRLRAPGWFRRNWYIVASVVPTLGGLLLWMTRHGRAGRFVRSLYQTVSSFLKERLRDPFMAICNELLKGRESFADSKARMEATETLKKMIRSFLDDYYPDMPEAERAKLAERQDVSLIERKKEESTLTFFDAPTSVRLAFLDMQFLKKELMNSLHAIDEMMSANDINMNIAAMTPAVIVAYTGSQIFRFFYYALLKLGKSREDTYSSFRQTLTDIERLLVMRDNPPSQPPPPLTDNDEDAIDDAHSSSTLHGNSGQSNGPCQLGPDDLGMVLLLVHECRGILWRDSRRFSKETIKNVSEDLAELAGERGAVSVQQQLKIIARMCRTYPFLKVISTGLPFQFQRTRSE